MPRFRVGARRKRMRMCASRAMIATHAAIMAHVSVVSTMRPPRSCALLARATATALKSRSTRRRRTTVCIRCVVPCWRCRIAWPSHRPPGFRRRNSIRSGYILLPFRFFRRLVCASQAFAPLRYWCRTRSESGTLRVQGVRRSCSFTNNGTR